MTSYYVDPAATGTDDGTSWTNAWTTLQRAIDGTGGTQPVAGDIVYCRGTETVSTMIDSDGNSGTATSKIRFVGTNGSGTVDGTRYVLNANNNTLTGVVNLVADHVWFENFEVANCTGHGLRCAGYAGCDFNLFANCFVHDNTGDGVNSSSSGLRHVVFLKCRVSDNGGYGLKWMQHVAVIDCAITGNTTAGLVPLTFSNNYTLVVNSLVEGNGGIGIDVAAGPCFVIGSVVDGNTGDGIEADEVAVIHSTRITENGVGIDADGTSLLAHVYMPNSTEDRDNTTKTTGTIVEYLSTNQLSGTDASGGYVNPAGGDFRLAAGATLREVEVSLDGTSKTYLSAGLDPQDTPGAGNRHPLARF